MSIIINREREGFILLLLLYITHFVECEILCPGMISLLIVYEDYSPNQHLVIILNDRKKVLA